MTRENLRRAVTTVVNATLEARDPAWWGEATSTASDSKRFASWDSNLMTEFHAGYGVMIEPAGGGPSRPLTSAALGRSNIQLPRRVGESDCRLRSVRRT